MMLFWIISAAMILAALAMLAPALLRNRQVESLDRDKQNLVIARERLAELEAERDNGTMTEAQFVQAKQELEQALLLDLDESGDEAVVQAGSNRAGLVGLVAIVVLVPLITLGLYAYLGSPQLTVPADQRMASAHAGAPANGQMPPLKDMVAALISRLKENPEDPEGWFLLGRTYMAMKAYSNAAGAFERLQTLVGDDPTVLLTWADALAMSQQGDLRGKPAELIRKAVELAPDDATALWLAGMVEAQAGDYKLAIRHWERLQPMVQEDAESSQRVASLLAEARKKSGLQPAEAAGQRPDTQVAAGQGGVKVRVVLAPALQDKVEPDEPLFIYAKALQGPRMPLAALRMQAKELPLEVSLDDSSAMTPQMRISNFKQVVVGARVSRSGNAIASPGDLKGEVSPVQVGGDGVVEIVIDQVVP